jgi:hypothetical protein
VFCSDGILAAYYHSLYNVQLYGPTNFAPVIRHVARFAQVLTTVFRIRIHRIMFLGRPDPGPSISKQK